MVKRRRNSNRVIQAYQAFHALSYQDLLNITNDAIDELSPTNMGKHPCISCKQTFRKKGLQTLTRSEYEFIYAHDLSQCGCDLCKSITALADTDPTEVCIKCFRALKQKQYP